MNNWPPAPKGTYYCICDELDKREDFWRSSVYRQEKVDNVPRYRWYKLALNSVCELEIHDKAYDIEGANFRDLKVYFKAIDWVAHNDPKALEYIMADLCNAVFPIVKSELIRNLQELGFYKACDIVQKHLRTKAPDLVRAYERRRRKVLKDLTNYAKDVSQRSNVLDSMRTNYPDKLYTKDPELVECLSAMLNVNKPGWLYTLDDNIDNILWLFKADKELLEHLFGDALCIEIKDLFIKPLIQLELYELVTFFKTCIPIIESDYPYYNIPPFIGRVDDLFDNDDISAMDS